MSNVKAEWKYYKNNGLKYVFKCTRCNYNLELTLDDLDLNDRPNENYSFCSKCGADMQVPKMCEILFRAKSANTWVYGYVYQDFKSNTSNKWRLLSPDDDTALYIDPKTICQYTGLIDKYGKKIFEGDMIHNNRDNYDAIIKCLNNLNEMVVEVVCGGIKDLSDIKDDEIEVIGNTYDN